MNKLKLILVSGLLNFIYIGHNSYASISSNVPVNTNNIYKNNKDKILFNINTMKDFFKFHSGRNYGWFGDKRPKIKFINISGESEFIDSRGNVSKKYVSLLNVDKNLLKNELKNYEQASKWIDEKLPSLGEYTSGIKFITVYSDKSKILEGNGSIKKNKFDKSNLNVPINYYIHTPSSIPSMAYKLKDLEKRAK